MIDVPFKDALHEARFKDGRALSQRGGLLAPECGARTRKGGRCRHPPLKGHLRCLRHAGPKAAREYRQRQINDLQAGKIGYEQFAAAEAKRTVNRLRDQWKKNAWAPGGTIDLSEHEARFRDEVRHWVGDMEAMPPGVLDWLRWRYRRLQVDRRDDEKWVTVLRSDLPRRVQDAGPRPSGNSDGTSELVAPAVVQPIWGTGARTPSYKRSKPDPDRRAQVVSGALPKSAKQKMPSAPDAKRIAEIVKASNEVLRPLLPACSGEDERSALVAALVAYVDQPENPQARRLWLDTVRALRAR